MLCLGGEKTLHCVVSRGRCGAAESVGGIQGNWDGVGALRCLILFGSLLVSTLFGIPIAR